MDSYTHLTPRWTLPNLRPPEKRNVAQAGSPGKRQAPLHRIVRTAQERRRAGLPPEAGTRKSSDTFQDSIQAYQDDPELIRRIEGLLRQKWSPEQVSGRLKRGASPSAMKPSTSTS